MCENKEHALNEQRQGFCPKNECSYCLEYWYDCYEDAIDALVVANKRVRQANQKSVIDKELISDLISRLQPNTTVEVVANNTTTPPQPNNNMVPGRVYNTIVDVNSHTNVVVGLCNGEQIPKFVFINL